ncbi:cytochrome P450 [Infundibulicybe gibba]|nr:cytochrome P450 [Infundibulicybe gibba]
MNQDSPTPPPPSFSTYLLSQQKSLALSDSETAYLAGSMFGAGSDTTASAISISVLAAALYPETYARVRSELLATCPTPPRLTDKPSLPQTTAFVLETFRWRPVSAGGFAHRATKDIIWNDTSFLQARLSSGTCGPSGATPPCSRIPRRLTPSGGSMRMGMYVRICGRLRLGLAGGCVPGSIWPRRKCPSSTLYTALIVWFSSVFLNTALLFWAFEISADPSAPIDPLAFTESANTHPLPFKVNFVPRDGVREAMEEYE